MRITKLFLVVVFLIAGPAAWAGSVAWNINVDTTSVFGSYGYLDFVFDPGPNTVAFATATVQGFTSDGLLDLSALITDGVVSGSLPGTLSFDNGTQLNDYSPGFTYGTFIDFQVNLAWSQPGTPPNSGSTFAFYMYDSYVIPLLTTSPGGEAFDLNVNPDNSISVSNYSSQATISPEPATLLMLIVPALALMRRRNR